MIDLRKVFFIFVVCLGIFGLIMTQQYILCLPWIIIAGLTYYLCFHNFPQQLLQQQKQQQPREYYKGHFFSS